MKLARTVAGVTTIGSSVKLRREQKGAFQPEGASEVETSTVAGLVGQNVCIFGGCG